MDLGHWCLAFGRTQEARVLPESDVMRLIVGGNLPAAQRFERLVFEKILPSIRRTGSYAAGPAIAPTDRKAIRHQLMITLQREEELEQQVEQQAVQIAALELKARTLDLIRPRREK